MLIFAMLSASSLAVEWAAGPETLWTGEVSTETGAVLLQ